MKDNKNKPVELVFSYNANNGLKNNLQAKIITDRQEKAESFFLILDDNHKLVRRYSFDDNGGGYRGL